jgi:hypothetical protein
MNEIDLPEKIARRYRRLRELFAEEEDALAAAYHVESKALALRVNKLLGKIPSFDTDDVAAVYDALFALEARLAELAQRT